MYLCTSNNNKKTGIMNNFNNTLTIEEARVVLSNRASFVNNPHNRKMIAEATHEILVKIQNK